ncbi:hypothetical protein ANCCAN_18440 [Ancylostoma caninum]|uniref:Uncharacterized protein n=1 Tax=Ancylostoma caninum TaxID=29170 RepID=A0A368FUB3_ANCCA|nr:hypothetical protein ANCCAN_18440 [Ancylostoma caninum]
MAASALTFISVLCVLPISLVPAVPLGPRHGDENIPNCFLLGEKALGESTRRHIVKGFAGINSTMVSLLSVLLKILLFIRCFTGRQAMFPFFLPRGLKE